MATISYNHGHNQSTPNNNQTKGAQVASVAAPQEQWDPFRNGPPKKQEKVRGRVNAWMYWMEPVALSRVSGY